jgi:hypothetical protein
MQKPETQWVALTAAVSGHFGIGSTLMVEELSGKGAADWYKKRARPATSCQESDTGSSLYEV